MLGLLLASVVHLNYRSAIPGVVLLSPRALLWPRFISLSVMEALSAATLSMRPVQKSGLHT